MVVVVITIAITITIVVVAIVVVVVVVVNFKPSLKVKGSLQDFARLNSPGLSLRCLR